MLQLHMYNRYRWLVLQKVKANMRKLVARLHNIASSIQKRDMAFVITKYRLYILVIRKLLMRSIAKLHTLRSCWLAFL